MYLMQRAVLTVGASESLIIIGVGAEIVLFGLPISGETI